MPRQHTAYVVNIFAIFAFERAFCLLSLQFMANSNLTHTHAIYSHRRRIETQRSSGKKNLSHVYPFIITCCFIALVTVRQLLSPPSALPAIRSVRTTCSLIRLFWYLAVHISNRLSCGVSVTCVSGISSRRFFCLLNCMCIMLRDLTNNKIEDLYFTTNILHQSGHSQCLLRECFVKKICKQRPSNILHKWDL